MFDTTALIRAALLGLALLTVTPFAAVAQDKKVPRVGIILIGGPGPSYDALRQGFARLGYEEGKSIILEPRFARGQLDKAREFASELVALNVDVIVGPGLVGIGNAKDFTKTIPIVFSAAPDPVALGYVASLERPGHNITGITSFDSTQAKQQIEILRSIVPRLTRVAVISDVDIPRVDSKNPIEESMSAAAKEAGVELSWIHLKGPTPDFTAVSTELVQMRAGALIVLEVPVPLLHLKQIADLAAGERLPSIFPAGWPNNGLISYGTSILFATARIPVYVDRILKGAKPADMPIEVVSKRELVINRKTARELGLTIPDELLKRADRVLE